MSFLLHPWTSRHPLSILGHYNGLLTGSAPSSLAHSAEAPHRTQDFLLNSKSDHMVPLLESLQCLRIALRSNSKSLTLSFLSNLSPLAFPSPDFKPCLRTPPSPWFCSAPTYYEPFISKKRGGQEGRALTLFSYASPSGPQLQGQGIDNVTPGLSSGKGVMDCPY